MIEQYMTQYDWTKGHEGEVPLYIMVSNDEFRLPLAVADSIAQLARLVDVAPSTISRIVNRKNKKRPCRYARVWVPEGELD